MKRRRSPAGAAILVALSLAAGAPAWAGSPTEEVRQYTEQILRTLEDPALAQADKRATVRKLAIEVFDAPEAARRALGRHWPGRTPEEQAEFVQLFVDLLERTYVSKIDLYGGERVRYTGESIEGDFAVVRAALLTRKGTEVPVEARMLKRGDRWRIYDVVVEHISFIANYRTQFDRIIRNSSYAELVNRLRTKRDELVAPKPATRSGPPPPASGLASGAGAPSP